MVTSRLIWTGCAADRAIISKVDRGARPVAEPKRRAGGTA